jgi:hypothetical protein
VSENLDLLVGDAERTAAAAALRDHYEAGRLTLDELEGRLDAVNAARTTSDIRTALRQLPQTATLPTLSPRDRRWRSLATQYAALNAIALLVWAASGAQGDFWPKWMLVATAILFLRRVAGPSRRHGRRSALPPPTDR